MRADAALDRPVRMLALASVLLGLVSAALLKVTEYAGFDAASISFAQMARGVSAPSTVASAFFDLRETFLHVHLAFVVLGVIALVIQALARPASPAARRALLAAPLLAVGAILFLPDVDRLGGPLHQQAEPWGRFLFLAATAAGIGILAAPRRLGLLLSGAGAVAFLGGALHAALRSPYAGPVERMPNWAFEAVWVAVGFTLLAAALASSWATRTRAEAPSVAPTG